MYISKVRKPDKNLIILLLQFEMEMEIEKDE